MARLNPRLRLALLLTAVATVGCDHVTKQVAISSLAGTPGRSFLADTIRLAYAENPGGFLSLGANLPPTARVAVFTVVTGFVLLGLAGAAIRFQWRGWPAFGLTLFVAGGLSNWFDRALRGSVVDFLNIGVGSLRTGIFNVADVAIVLGAVVLLVAEIRRDEHQPS